MPASKQHWPNAAACWSPIIPATGIAAPNSAGSVVPKSEAQSLTCGSIESGMPKRVRSLSSHSWLVILKSCVREALVASVQWLLPPLRRQSKKLSMVPKASSPASARVRALGTLSSSQRSLLAEKYESISKPVASCTIGSWPARRSPSQYSAVRRSCQTIALAIGFPVSLSHTTVVSR